MRLPWIDSSRAPLNIAVVGDVMLDEYLKGQVDHISPEAPVVVHNVTGQTHVPGGAANAAHNIQTAGAQAYLVGCVGRDASYEILLDLCRQAGIDASHLMSIPGLSTIKKTRIITRSQQLMRIDWEKEQRLKKSWRTQLYKRLESLSWDGMLISDYGKGLLTADFCGELIELARQRQVPVVVDPPSSATTYRPYRGASLIKPNYKEACNVLGLGLHPLKQGAHLAQKIFHHHRHHTPQYDLLITLGERGMVHARSDGSVLEEKSTSKEVYDVSGAGDTVAAIACLALCCRTPWPFTLKLASVAAGIVIEKIGTSPITAAELSERLTASSSPGISPGVMSPSEAREVTLKLKGEGKVVVMAGGCFDLLHIGHVTYLKQARALGDYLFVALNSDASIRKLKGEARPVVPESERAQMLAALRSVDGVVVFGGDSALDLVQALQPDFFVKGADWPLDQIVERTAVEAYGGQVRSIPLVEGKSSSQIISTIGHRISAAEHAASSLRQGQ